MKKLINEFKEFALKGNVLDLAIAVIMGGAVGKMVSALVDFILMPMIGVILGGTNFSSLSIQIGGANIMYGAFIQAVIDFLIIAFCLFLIMRQVTQLQKVIHPDEKQPAETKPTAEELLTEIRDLLKEAK